MACKECKELKEKYDAKVALYKWEVKNITRKLDYLCKQLDRACEKK